MSRTSCGSDVELQSGDYQKGCVEVAFLLDAFASTIDTIMGGNTAPVGRIAGRDTAKKLPVELAGATLEEAVALLSERMGAGFRFELSGERLSFEKCILRQMCALRRIEAGGPLCRLFHSYFDGIVNGLICRPVKSHFQEVGETCSFVTEVQ